ncbi:MAG: tetratricopeptide repeat protein [Nitrospinaceae bacterium]|nr:tetratricopeptide repeat protein [Nitrospinaceae bacterium]NIR53639.1 tetratricopeptide repeat protein [Nitrospinaceae bacterium]NIS84045.1 tetratricopeptide repeat protein [Nitrospinaceae bacterium]NIT80846.1 tetratricopeptide repeat protein [Nitrospinaceae bacterium]NIU43155.1 tetratricopeptide repeat protein [Nitrospinaceae bacterium]
MKKTLNWFVRSMGRLAMSGLLLFGSGCAGSGQQVSPDVEPTGEKGSVAPDVSGKSFSGREKAKGERLVQVAGESIRVNPQDADAYVQRAKGYILQFEMDRAQADFEKALAINPRLVRAYTERAEMYFIMGEDYKAIEDYSQAIKIDPKLMDAYFRRGTFYENIGEPGKALADYSQVIQLNPNYAPGYFQRGYILHRRGELERALKDYNRAIALWPDVYTYYYQRGNVYYAQGQFKKAARDFEQTAKLDPRASHYERAGRIHYRELNNKPKGCRLYRRACDLGDCLHTTRMILKNQC